ncbi:trehalose-6-phosphate synthase [Bdellovibrionota bacterium FG-2]
MRSLLRFLAVLAPVLAIIAWVSVNLFEKLQDSWIEKDLARRSQLIFSSVEEGIQTSLASGNLAGTKRLLNRLGRDELIHGILICIKSDTAENKALPKAISNDSLSPILRCETLASQPESSIVTAGDINLNVWRFELAETTLGPASVYIVNDSSAWYRRKDKTRVYIFALFIGIAIIVIFFSTLIGKWTISRPMQDLAFILRDAMKLGNPRARLKSLAKTEFAPLVRDLNHIAQEFQRLKSTDTTSEAGIWTAERLRDYVTRNLRDLEIAVIANREPYIHDKKPDGSLQLLQPASGLVTGVEPILRACNGTWIAHGSGSGDRETVDSKNTLRVPPDKPEYSLRRVWLTPEEEEGYYYGFSNEGLWPLCHIAHQRPRFDENDWEQYIKANKRFAEAFKEQYGNKRVTVLIQDYHFSLLPRMIREISPDSLILLFWHIPWPNPEAFGICPWRREILDGMLAADVLGFHTQFHCNNFIETVDRYVESRIDREFVSIQTQGHECRVRAFPISIRTDRERKPGTTPDIRSEHGLPADTLVAVGVDRVDYTKGILERIKGVRRFAERRPDLAKKFAFIQIGAPSRIHIPVYKRLNEEVHALVDETNLLFREKLGRDLIILKLYHHNPEDIQPYYEQANICLVTPLHDGMNLVAKEYVAARTTEDGVLILSQFAGASREFREALIINPYGPDDIATNIITACEMTHEDQRNRMRRMRKTVKENNVYRWGHRLLKELNDVKQFRQIGGPPS